MDITMDTFYCIKVRDVGNSDLMYATGFHTKGITLTNILEGTKWQLYARQYDREYMGPWQDTVDGVAVVGDGSVVCNYLKDGAGFSRKFNSIYSSWCWFDSESSKETFEEWINASPTEPEHWD